MGTEPYRGAPAPAGSPGPCPRCPGTGLEPRTAGRLAVAMCRSCRGIWIGESAYLVLFGADEDVQRLARADAATPPSGRSGPAPCPACREVMEVQSGASTGVTLDVCARHGVWLDAGELGALLGPGVDDDTPGLLDRVARWLIPERD